MLSSMDFISIFNQGKDRAIIEVIKPKLQRSITDI